MKTLSFALICAALLTFGNSALAENDKDTTTLNQIVSYRQWTRVNPEPVEVSVPVTRTDGRIAIDSLALS